MVQDAVPSRRLYSFVSAVLAVHIVRDAVWGDIRLTDEEYQVANAFEMLRLNRLRQLHLCYLVYPSATHTRYAHSLGTLQVAKRVAAESELQLSPDDRRLFFLAALLHDVGHSAFAHVLEPSIKGMLRHEDMRAAILDGTIIENYLREGLLSQREVARLEAADGFVSRALNEPTIASLKGIFAGDPPWIAGLVDNVVDVDTMDYLARDTQYVGILGRPYDPCLFSAFRIEKRPEAGERALAVVFSNDLRVHNALEDVSYSRWFLFRNAYLHPTVMAANAMLIRAFEAGPAEQLRTRAYLMGEDELLSSLAKIDGECGTLATRLLSRHLYKPVFAINTLVGTRRPTQGAGFQAARRTTRRRVRVVEKGTNAADQPTIDPLELARAVAEKPVARGEFQRRAKEEVGFEPLVGYPLIPPSKDYPGILIEGGLTFRQVSPSDVVVYQERYPKLSTMYIYSPDPLPARRAALAAFCERYFQSVGEYGPPSGLETTATEASICELVADLSREFPGASRVLRHLTGPGPVTLKTLMSGTGLKKATVSAHLRSIDKVLRRIPTPVMVSRMNGRTKEWYIQRPDLRTAISNALGGRAVEQKVAA